MIHYLILPYYHLTFTCLLQKCHVNLNQTIYWLNKNFFTETSIHSKPSYQRQFSSVQDSLRKREKFFSIEFHRFSHFEALFTFIMRHILNYLVPDIVKMIFLCWTLISGIGENLQNDVWRGAQRAHEPGGRNRNFAPRLSSWLEAVQS